MLQAASTVAAVIAARASSRGPGAPAPLPAAAPRPLAIAVSIEPEQAAAPGQPPRPLYGDPAGGVGAGGAGAGVLALEELGTPGHCWPTPAVEPVSQAAGGRLAPPILRAESAESTAEAPGGFKSRPSYAPVAVVIPALGAVAAPRRHSTTTVNVTPAFHAPPLQQPGGNAPPTAGAWLHGHAAATGRPPASQAPPATSPSSESARRSSLPGRLPVSSPRGAPLPLPVALQVSGTAQGGRSPPGLSVNQASHAASPAAGRSPAAGKASVQAAETKSLSPAASDPHIMVQQLQSHAPLGSAE